MNRSMKITKLSRALVVILLIHVLSLQTACIVYHTKDQGKHKGWRKGPAHPGNSHNKMSSK